MRIGNKSTSRKIGTIETSSKFLKKSKFLKNVQTVEHICKKSESVTG